MAAIDFTTIEVWTQGGLVTFYLLFVMEIASRRVHCAGCTPNPQEAWMRQIARNLIDPLEGFPNDSRYWLMDRDTKLCEAFRGLVEDTGMKCVRLPHRSPNLNSHIERFMRSIREEGLDRMVCLSVGSRFETPYENSLLIIIRSAITKG